MTIAPIKQTEASKSPVAAARKQDPTALRNKALNILHEPSKVDVGTLVQRVTDKPNLFDSFDSDVFHGKLK